MTGLHKRRRKERRLAGLVLEKATLRSMKNFQNTRKLKTIGRCTTSETAEFLSFFFFKSIDSNALLFYRSVCQYWQVYFNCLPFSLLGNQTHQLHPPVPDCWSYLFYSFVLSRLDHNNSLLSACYPLHLLSEIRRISSIRQHLKVEVTKTLLYAFILSRLDHSNSLLTGCPFYLHSQLQKVQKSAAKLVFKTGKRDHVQPLSQTLHWFPVQARIDYKLWTACHNVFPDSSPAYFSDRLTTHTLLQTHGFFGSPMLEQNPLANVVSRAVLQSNGNRSLLTSVTFNPPMPSKLR